MFQSMFLSMDNNPVVLHAIRLTIKNNEIILEHQLHRHILFCKHALKKLDIQYRRKFFWWNTNILRNYIKFNSEVQTNRCPSTYYLNWKKKEETIQQTQIALLYIVLQIGTAKVDIYYIRKRTTSNMNCSCYCIKNMGYFS